MSYMRANPDGTVVEWDQRCFDVIMFHKGSPPEVDPTSTDVYLQYPDAMDHETLTRIVKAYAPKVEYNKKLKTLLRKELQIMDEFDAIAREGAIQFRQANPPQNRTAHANMFNVTHVTPFLEQKLIPLNEDINALLKNKMVPPHKIKTQSGVVAGKTDFLPFLMTLYDIGKRSYGKNFRSYSNKSEALLTVNDDIFPLEPLIQNTGPTVRCIENKRIFDEIILKYLDAEFDQYYKYIQLREMTTQRIDREDLATFCYNLKKLNDAFTVFLETNLDFTKMKRWLKPVAWGCPYDYPFHANDDNDAPPALALLGP